MAFTRDDFQSWAGTLSGVFGQVYSAVNPPATAPPPQVRNLGIPSSQGSLTPVQQTGVGALAVIAGVAIIVWLLARR